LKEKHVRVIEITGFLSFDSFVYDIRSRKQWWG